MSSMTKDQLREALVAHGVDPPPVNARKAEYIAVYRAQISDLGLFSSDDDEDEDDDEMQAKTASPKKLNSTAATKSAQKTSRSSSLIVNGENLEDLTDDQLFRRLKDNGIQAGPIVESTRKFYLRKLAEIMNGGGDKTETEVEAANASTMVNGKSSGRSSPKKKTTKKITNGLDQFSADEETADEPQPEVIVSKSRANTTNTTTTSTTSKTLTPTSLRQRIKDTMEESRDRFTPTPRRSIHSYKVTESSRESLTRSPDGKLSRSYTYKKDTYDSDKDFKNTALGRVVRWLPKIFMLIIFAAVVYYTLQEHGDKLTKVYLQMTKGLPQEPVLDRPSGEGAEPREPLDEQPSIGNV